MGDPAPARATVRQAVVLAPLPQEVAGRPVLAWQLEELVRFGVTEAVVAAPGPDTAALVRTVAAILPRRLDVVPAAATGCDANTLGRLRGRLDPRFLLCDGAVVFDANLARLLADGAGDGPDVLGRTLLCPPSGVMPAGPHLLRRDVLDQLAPGPSVVRDVLPRLLANGAVRGTEATGNVFDLRRPEDRRRAEVALSARPPRRALFLDRDGVLNVDHGYVGGRDRWEWTPTARDAVAAATARGWHVFVVTNQSGIARGRFDEAALRGLQAWVEDEIHAAGGTVDDWRYAPHHPDAVVPAFRHPDHPWRKPRPGMLLDLLRCWRLDPARCVMVGDQRTDMAAAAAAGMPGVLFDGANLLALVEQVLDAPPATGERPAAVAPHARRS